MLATLLKTNFWVVVLIDRPVAALFQKPVTLLKSLSACTVIFSVSTPISTLSISG